MRTRTTIIHTALACLCACGGSGRVERFARPDVAAPANGGAADWLVDPITAEARVDTRYERGEVVLTNGLISRTFRLVPNAATVAYDNLMTGESILRAVQPEARVTLDGVEYDVGGLVGQEEHGYLLPEWVDSMEADRAAFVMHAQGHQRPYASRLRWKRVRHCEARPWPPPGTRFSLIFAAPPGGPEGVEIEVHYELYDGVPVLAKWFELRNEGTKTVRLERFTADLLAAFEYESAVESPTHWEHPNIHVETDYAFGGMTPKGSDVTVRWVPDPEHSSQVNYKRLTPNLLTVAPPIGPDVEIAPGGEFTSFRTFHLVHDSTDRERKGLAARRMYRTIAPWVTENPILMHVRSAQPDAVRLAIDQCAEVGFEMVILTFGSGFDIENTDPAYLAQIRELVDYAHAKGVELGGYSLLASRRISDEHDVVNPETGKPGGFARYGNSPCLQSQWGLDYFAKLERFIEATGLDLLEHDGNYPGDVCASTEHPGHRGLGDSQWTQHERITDFYRWCRARGTYLNVPDWYFLSGSNKIGMGYREVNWSLPRERQIILGRQNVYDGTWEKTPSMGWMFVPLVEYHGGGAAATLEPLAEHLDAYERHLANNFAAGVQACYRGPRLYDSEETKAVVEKWVGFYRRYREILDSDVIHLRRPDGRDWDGLLHVNPTLEHRGMLVIHNPTGERIERTIRVPLYYTGLRGAASVSREGAAPARFELDREYGIELPVDVGASDTAWYVISAP